MKSLQETSLSCKFSVELNICDVTLILHLGHYLFEDAFPAICLVLLALILSQELSTPLHSLSSSQSETSLFVCLICSLSLPPWQSKFSGTHFTVDLPTGSSSVLQSLYFCFFSTMFYWLHLSYFGMIILTAFLQIPCFPLCLLYFKHANDLYRSGYGNQLPLFPTLVFQIEPKFCFDIDTALWKVVSKDTKQFRHWETDSDYSE